MQNYEYLLSFTVKAVGCAFYQNFGCYYTSKVRLHTHKELVVAGEFCIRLFEERNNTKIDSYNLLTAIKVWEL